MLLDFLCGGAIVIMHIAINENGPIVFFNILGITSLHTCNNQNSLIMVFSLKIHISQYFKGFMISSMIWVLCPEKMLNLFIHLFIIYHLFFLFSFFALTSFRHVQMDPLLQCFLGVNQVQRL